MNALIRLVNKYKEQIPEFKSRSVGLSLEQAEKKVEKTGVQCPQCKSAELIKRQSRGRTFYGCGSFPKCKYITPSLENLKDSED